MTGYELLTSEQREEVDSLVERKSHAATMRFTELDAQTLSEYESLCNRLEVEARK